MNQTSQIIVITGATASGKTKLAIELAKQIDAEIICADSRIIYKDLDVVSAKPTVQEQDGIKHHLIDIKTPTEGLYSAGEFMQDAKQIINNSKKPVIIQGGTWFYIKTLLDNKDLIQFGKNEKLREELSKLTNEELHKMLSKKDLKRASLVHPNNRDKVIRSLELIEALGAKLSEHERKDNEKYNAIWFMPEFPREELYERINLRVDLMMKDGLYEEWLRNKEKYGKCEVLYNTIGYREFFDLEDGIYATKEEAADKIKQHTRNFAKRQLSWFNQNKEPMKIHAVTSLQHVTKILSI